jgi:hypothetical protein
MGFKRSVEDAHGVTHAEAYHKIDLVRISWADKKCIFTIAVYPDQAKCNAGKNSLESESLSFSINSDGYDLAIGTVVLDAADMNLIKALYNYAKTELDDESIIDC